MTTFRVTCLYDEIMEADEEWLAEQRALEQIERNYLHVYEVVEGETEIQHSQTREKQR